MECVADVMNVTKFDCIMHMIQGYKEGWKQWRLINNGRPCITIGCIFYGMA